MPYWISDTRKTFSSKESQFSGDAPSSPASFAETAEPWKKAQWWHTSVIFEVLCIQDGFFNSFEWMNGMRHWKRFLDVWECLIYMKYIHITHITI